MSLHSWANDPRWKLMNQLRDRLLKTVNLKKREELSKQIVELSNLISKEAKP